MTNTAIITYIKNISYAYGKVLYQKIGLVETYLDRVMIFVVCVRIATELQQNSHHSVPCHPASSENHIQTFQFKSSIGNCCHKPLTGLYFGLGGAFSAHITKQVLAPPATKLLPSARVAPLLSLLCSPMWIWSCALQKNGQFPLEIHIYLWQPNKSKKELAVPASLLPAVNIWLWQQLLFAQPS